MVKKTKGQDQNQGQDNIQDQWQVKVKCENSKKGKLKRRNVIKKLSANIEMMSKINDIQSQMS